MGNLLSLISFQELIKSENLKVKSLVINNHYVPQKLSVYGRLEERMINIRELFQIVPFQHTRDLPYQFT